MFLQELKHGLPARVADMYPGSVDSETEPGGGIGYRVAGSDDGYGQVESIVRGSQGQDVEQRGKLRMEFLLVRNWFFSRSKPCLMAMHELPRQGMKNP